MADKKSILPIALQGGVLTTAEDYIARAKSGEKLSEDERRHAIAFIDTQYPEISNLQMAKLFQVDESTIRFDLRQIKQGKADTIREDTDAKLIIADLLATRDRAIRNIWRAISEMEKKGEINTKKYIEANRIAYDIYQASTKQLQDMGWLPKNLGTVTVNKHVYKSFVQAGTGAVETRPLNLFDDIREGEQLEDAIQRHLKAQDSFIQEAEYEEVPIAQLPAATDIDAQRQEETRTNQSEGTEQNLSQGECNRAVADSPSTTQQTPE